MHSTRKCIAGQSVVVARSTASPSFEPARLLPPPPDPDEGQPPLPDPGGGGGSLAALGRLPPLELKKAKRLEPEEKEKEAAPAPAVWPAERELDASPSGRGVLLSARKNEREDNGEY